MQLRTRISNRRRGFTLVELMVVVLIIAVLAALVVPNIMGASGKAKIAAAHSDLTGISGFLDGFELDCGRYPTTEEGLDALSNAPSSLGSKWKGPYAKKPVLNDPWGNPYQYESTGDHYTVKSYGADGQEGGADGSEAADIVEQG